MSKKICEIKDCDLKVLGVGLCSKHYARKRKYGDPNKLMRSPNGSGNRRRNGNVWIYKPNHINAGKNGKVLEHVFVLSNHLNRKINLKKEYIIHIDGNRSNNSLENLKLVIKREICKAEDCKSLVHAKDLCARHHKRIIKYGDYNHIMTREKGTGTINEGGYKLIWEPNHPNANASGRILEHRLIMSNFLNRPLLPTEYVHHKNGNRLDNRIENLELCCNQKQPPGQRVKDLIVWARDILNIYDKEFSNKFSKRSD